jgi:drug/metabolite transporter (DMT)-like permease
MHHGWAGAFALFSAFLWTLSAIIFKKLGKKVLPVAMNLGKGVVASILLGILILFTDRQPVSNHSVIFLGLSGILGITFGDTFYFESLVRLGPRLSLIVTILIPVVTVILAATILRESLLPAGWAGIFFTLLGVLLVLLEKEPAGVLPKDFKPGIMYGVLSVLCCASAIIFSKTALDSVSVLRATFIRQVAGVIGLIFLGLGNFKVRLWLKPVFNDPVLLKRLVYASFIGTFLGTLFSILALKYTFAAIATTLNSTSPLFILLLAFFVLKEKISLRAVIGSFIAVAGVGLIFLGGG